MDYHARRLHTTLLLGTAFLAGVTIGPASGLIARHVLGSLGISAAFAQDTDRADTYRLLTLFGDVFERVRSEYVDPISDKGLMENAINGMLIGLDPHSSYMNAEEFHEMQAETKGEFGGLGIEVVPENGFFKVIRAMDDTPASRAGIKAGNTITRVDGKSVQGLLLEKNEGGTPDRDGGPRTDLLPIVRTIPTKPPNDFPESDPAKPDDTDFQLQQGLVVAMAMASARP